MALEYELCVDGDIRPVDLLARIAPTLAAPEVRSEPYNDGLTLALEETHGFVLSIFPSDETIVEAGPQYGGWVWTPQHTTDIGFQVSKQHPDLAYGPMKLVLDRVLATGDEDLTFTGNDVLYLARMNGVVTTYNGSPW